MELNPRFSRFRVMVTWLRKELGENGYKLQYSKLRGRYLHVISSPIYGPLGKESRVRVQSLLVRF